MPAILSNSVYVIRIGLCHLIVIAYDKRRCSAMEMVFYLIVHHRLAVIQFILQFQEETHHLLRFHLKLPQTVEHGVVFVQIV